MASQITSALAVDFDHTASVGPAVDVGALPVDTMGVAVYGNVPTGTYRMWLAPSASCFLRTIAAVINAALAGEGSTVTVAVSLSAAGVVTFTFSGDVTILELSAAIAARLGMSTSQVPTGYRTVTGTRPVWFLATFTSQRSKDWVQFTPSASAATAEGVEYGVTSDITTWRDEVTFDFVPRDPTNRTALGLDQTPWEPEPTYLGSIGTVADRLHSVSDFLRAAYCRTVAYSRSFPSLITSTSQRYDIVSLSGRECMAPRVTKLVDDWDAYRTWTIAMTRQATPTGTRA